MFPPSGRGYLVGALDHTPATLSALLASLPGDDAAAWDARPDPERFTLREVVAHLADWDGVWRERFARVLDEERPLLSRPDITRRAEEKGYASADPRDSLERFAGGRAALTAWLRALPDDAWSRLAHLDRMGDFPLEGLAALALGHDAYHLRQAAEWVAAVLPRHRPTR